MKTLLAAKPVVAVTTFGCVAVLATAVQMAVAQGDGNAAGGALALQSSVDGGTAALPAPPAAFRQVASSDAAPNADQPQDPRNNPRMRTLSDAPTLSGDELEQANRAQQLQQKLDQKIDDAIFRLRFTDSKDRSWMEERTEAVLQTEVDNFDWVDVPLEEVVKEFGWPMRINIILDTVALDELGLGPDQPVSASLKHVTVGAVLRRLLAPYELTYVVQEDGLLITSQEKADTILETRVYPWTGNRLKEVLPQVVAPDSWGVHAGSGSIIDYGDRYLIRQTYAVHAEINRLLLELKREERE